MLMSFHWDGGSGGELGSGGSAHHPGLESQSNLNHGMV